jgi:uncharacterized damage-inducible protein DinB
MTGQGTKAETTGRPHISLGEVRAILSSTRTTLRALVEGASPDALVFREAPGSWTPLEVLCHLVDGEVTDWIPRLELMLSDDGPKRFTPFDREAGFVKYAGWTAPELLDEFGRLRSANLTQLSRIGRDEDLRRTGVHPELGLVTLEQLLACWATHDMAHIAQISRTLVRYFGAHVGPWRAYFSLLRTEQPRSET